MARQSHRLPPGQPLNKVTRHNADTIFGVFQLKKLINQVVIELSALGLNPAVLQRFITEPSQHSRFAAPTAIEPTDENTEPDYAAVYEVARKSFESILASKVSPEIPLSKNQPRLTGSLPNYGCGCPAETQVVTIRPCLSLKDAHHSEPPAPKPPGMLGLVESSNLLSKPRRY